MIQAIEILCRASLTKTYLAHNHDIDTVHHWWTNIHVCYQSSIDYALVGYTEWKITFCASCAQREREEGRQKKLQKKAPFRMLCNDLFHRQDESSDVSDNGDDDGSDDEGAAMGAQIKTVNGGKKYGRGRYLASSDLLYPADFVGSVSDIARAMPPSWRIVKVSEFLINAYLLSPSDIYNTSVKHKFVMQYF